MTGERLTDRQYKLANSMRVLAKGLKIAQGVKKEKYQAFKDADRDRLLAIEAGRPARVIEHRKEAADLAWKSFLDAAQYYDDRVEANLAYMKSELES